MIDRSPRPGRQLGQPGKRRKHEVPPNRDLLFVEGKVIVSLSGHDRVMVRRVGLDDHFPGEFPPPGPAGRIECAIDRPEGSALGVAVVCHPHPQHGGTMREP